MLLSSADGLEDAVKEGEHGGSGHWLEFACSGVGNERRNPVQEVGFVLRQSTLSLHCTCSENLRSRTASLG